MVRWICCFGADGEGTHAGKRTCTPWTGWPRTGRASASNLLFFGAPKSPLPKGFTAPQYLQAGTKLSAQHFL